MTITRRQPEVVADYLQDLHPVLKKVYQHRGVVHPEQLERTLQALLPFNTLKGIDAICQRLAQAYHAQERLLIVGDFDADGATSTAVAIRGLRLLGFQHVDYLVPNRFDFGYGLSPELVDYAFTHKSPQVIITVDNGISSVSGVQRANELGIAVLITDHHLAGTEIPEALAIVNPNQPGCPFESKSLAGVGVIFYVLLALRAYFREQQIFSATNPEPNLANLLDIVALGTVADVVPLDKNNRILVYQGLERIRRGRACAGIQALITVGNRQAPQLSASDMGFVIGPRLNAAGRLEDMSLGIECLLTDDPLHAQQIAQQLNQLNSERQFLEQEMKEQAMQILQQFQLQEGTLPISLCLFDESWHQGVVGILASRIKERYHRPVICFAVGNDTEIKGSARSIPGCHIRDALANVANRYPDLIVKYGGHAMAAGLTIRRENLEKFRAALNEAIETMLAKEYLVQQILSDGELQSNHFNLDLAYQIKHAGPWGQAFPEPIFDNVFNIIDQKIIAEKHLKFTLDFEGQHVEAIAFNCDNEWLQNSYRKIKAAYRLDINEFRGQRKLQLILQHLEQHPS